MEKEKKNTSVHCNHRNTCSETKKTCRTALTWPLSTCHDRNEGSSGCVKQLFEENANNSAFALYEIAHSSFHRMNGVTTTIVCCNCTTLPLCTQTLLPACGHQSFIALRNRITCRRYSRCSRAAPNCQETLPTTRSGASHDSRHACTASVT